MINNQYKQLGPPKTSFNSFILQLFGSLGGGIFGTSLMLMFFMIGSSIFKPVFNFQNEIGKIEPMFIFLFMAMIFLGSISSNCLSIFLISLSDKEKYQQINSTILQVFVINIFLFILLAPIYLIVNSFYISSLPYVAGLQIIMGSFASLQILKIISTHKYALLGIYSGTFSFIVTIGLNILIYKLFNNDLTILLFSALPITWLVFSILEALFNILYYYIYSMYGTDFLSSELKYGRDTQTLEDEINNLSDEEKEKAYLEAEKDSTGAEFLKNQK
ncbi:MAG: hypothetical protein UR27_C0018G0021 [Candidatus Peregrinibacteria bacterium GW2011_GWA2_33_10]|nr:MAG: hypothetical protein UR27_C0018G0021 [Candidatus Peregrinibacteria bacterium GW2011_GWA2_33_10]KKP38788.1 MAG: hypothetical protein UR30_C0015G0021 [Candidatus Peregrinibacteria bacterium GW2011_GWC2_33_13]